ncbi:hypothetical protein DFH06DRAFT_1128523 [Mycena polygramma]|nr:hypothetical protein DFH06DRAFT_1128523 [Mycena polygramma]
MAGPRFERAHGVYSAAVQYAPCGPPYRGHGRFTFATCRSGGGYTNDLFGLKFEFYFPSWSLSSKHVAGTGIAAEFLKNSKVISVYREPESNGCPLNMKFHKLVTIWREGHGQLEHPIASLTAGSIECVIECGEFSFRNRQAPGEKKKRKEKKRTGLKLWRGPESNGYTTLGLARLSIVPSEVFRTRTLEAARKWKQKTSN